jgi:hypothetical protein
MMAASSPFSGSGSAAFPLFWTVFPVGPGMNKFGTCVTRLEVLYGGGLEGGHSRKYMGGLGWPALGREIHALWPNSGIVCCESTVTNVLRTCMFHQNAFAHFLGTNEQIS